MTATIITYFDDYCFDCQVSCKQIDEEHLGHKRLSVGIVQKDCTPTDFADEDW